MPIVDIDRGSELDKVHAQRMLHAFSQVVLELFALQDGTVDRILNKYSILLAPGPIAGIDYPEGGKQVLADRLAYLNSQEAERKAESDKLSGKAPAKKSKAKKRK